jgi:hypothetical protein
VVGAKAKEVVLNVVSGAAHHPGNKGMAASAAGLLEALGKK